MRSVEILCYNYFMVNLYTAKEFNTCLDKLICLIQVADVKDLENNHIILVPDKYSLNIEKRVLDNLISKGALNIEVLTFSRLIIRLKEIDIKKYIQLSDAVMIIKKLCLEHSGKFKTFNKSANLKTFAENMLLLINQFKSSNISPLDLKNSLPRLSASFSKKLYDIVVLYEKYTEFLGKEFFDASDMLRELPKILSESEFIKSCNVYAIGFDSLTVLAENSINALSKHAKSLNLFAIKTEKENLLKINYAYEKYLKLKDVKETFVKSCENEIFSVLENNLFNLNYKTAENGGINIYQGSGIFDEVTKCAIDINYSALGLGLRYADIGVVFTDEKIGRTIENVFSAHNIPFYIESKKTLDSHPFPKLMLDIINLQRLNFDRGNFLAVLKNPFLKIDFDLQDSFENYVLKYAVDRQKFLKELEKYSDNEKEFVKIESARKKILSAVNLLKMQEKDTALNYCAILRNFIEKFSAKEKLQEFNDNLKSGNFLAYSGFSEQILSNIQEVLSSLEHIFKNIVFSLEEFYKILLSGLSAKELSLIPKVTDCVNCGDYKSMVFSKFKKLYILGCIQNNYPVITQNAGIIKDEDIDLLTEKGLILEPKTEDINERERYYIYSMFLNAPKNLSISYSASIPADCVVDIKNSFIKNGKELEIESGDFIGTKDEVKEFYNKNRLINYFCEKLIKIKNGLTDDGMLFNILKSVKDGELKDSFKEIYKKLKDTEAEEVVESGIFFKNGLTSISALETYFACPFKNFLRYGLNAKIREAGEFKPVNIGSFLHLAAEKYVSGNDFNSDVKKQSDKIFEEIIGTDEYKKYLNDPFCKNILYKLKDELNRVLAAIEKQFNNSDFKPLYTEANFGVNQKLPAIELEGGGKKISVKGVIDRIDILKIKGEEYIRIIDYKSGVSAYSENDLYYGKKIQLFIYLSALTKLGYKPAGVYYFPIGNKFIKKDKPKSAYRMNGPTVDDLDVIFASDKSLKDEKISEIIDIKIDGEKIGKYSKVLSFEDFELLSNYAKALCCNAVKEIFSGNIDIFPAPKACEFCDYLSICKNYNYQKQRKFKPAGLEDIKQAMQGVNK